MGARPLLQSDTLTGVVAALPGEARTARAFTGLNWRVTVGGVGMARARAAAQTLIASGAERLLVWGVAAALRPDLQPGALVVPGEVLDAEGERYPVSSIWQQRLLACAPASVMTHSGPLVTVGQPVVDRRAKTRLAQQSGAVAVDMEAAAIARVAAEQDLPFAVVRTIADPLQQSLPPVISRTQANRHLALGVALRLPLCPRDWPRILALGRNMQAAKRSLAGVARCYAKQQQALT